MTFGTLVEDFMQKLCISCTSKIKFLEFASDQFLEILPELPEFLVDQFLIIEKMC